MKIGCVLTKNEVIITDNDKPKNNIKNPLLIVCVPNLSREVIALDPVDVLFSPAVLNPLVIDGTTNIIMKKPIANINIVISQINISETSAFLFI